MKDAINPCQDFTCDAHMQLLPCPCDLKRLHLSETPQLDIAQNGESQTRSCLDVSTYYGLCGLSELVAAMSE